jgi:putative protein kinase ArgK-like GTPase of G3E family
MLQLRASHGDVPVLSTTATSGAGVAELAAAIEAVWAAKGRPPPGTRLKRIIAEAAVREVRARILESPLLAAVAAAVERGELDVAGAASELVRALGET